MTAVTEPQNYSVALSFEDGVTRFITCREDQTVADASYRQRINIPLDCRDGACGTCKAHCESGSYDGGIYIDDALPADEAEAGYVLPCSMKPRSDLVLQIAGTSDVAKTQAATYTGTLVELTRLSPTIVRFAVEIPNRSELAFLPGQYVNVAVPGTDVHRSYSFANAPHEPRLTFLVKLTEGGAMSDYLSRRAAVGDTLTFTGPNGSFFLREAKRPVLMLAGGTGLAPILSMLRKMAADGSCRKAHLIYGAKTDDDVVALDELREIASQVPGFTWDHCVSDPQTRAANQGRVMTLIEPAQLYDGDVAIYLCGPPAMVESVRKHVAATGIEPTGFYYEKFALAHGGSPADDAQDIRTATGGGETLLPAPDARAVAGQEMLVRNATAAITPWPRPATVGDTGDTARRIAGQLMAPVTDGVIRPLDDDSGTLIASASRSVCGQPVFAPPRALITAHAGRSKQTMRRAMADSEQARAARRPKFITPGRFAGKVVVVTGAAQGIGEHTARRISAEDGILVLADRSELVEELADELAAAGPRTLAVTADLEHDDGADTLVRQAITEFGRIDVLINNVGGAINFKPFTTFTAEQIRAEITRSLMTTLYSCRAVLPSMVERGTGVIVNVSSAATRGVHRIPYSAAKGGINALTASLAMEYADAGIRVVATAPGGTEAPPRRISRGTPQATTDTERAWFQAHIDQTLESSLMHRYGTLAEQAAAICFLASDEASYITGSVLPVAGGDQG
ncbi:oxidoreductase [Mycolicibacterium wolinskyi]|uniref:Oxidoreductase n=1 Tax=Mycolicibacterium wolinskyi TaxID=59750 RepID=A0A132PH67_9MYCO|nr:benzoate 1,2-dioxygenase electron transfer component BenC [Mycolicibacterium wolinskyi]KWX21342.1 oxidoreductase [Mycolicibacterium wolinskyi]